MKQEALSYFPHMWMAIVALLLFFGVFCGVLWQITRKSKAEYFNKMASLPLAEGDDK